MHPPERRTLAGLLALVALLLAVPGVARAHGPLAPYRWVTPPPEAASGNVTPLDRTADLPAERDRLRATDVWTGDLQAVVSFVDTPLARDRSAVSIAITARDAATLGPLPASLNGDGNVYEVSLTDGGADVGPLSVEGRIILAVPQAATAVLFSADGNAWTILPVTSPQPNQVEAALARPGYYLAATDHSLSGGSGSSGMRGPAVAALVALPVLALGGLVAFARRRRVSSP